MWQHDVQTNIFAQQWKGVHCAQYYLWIVFTQKFHGWLLDIANRGGWQIDWPQTRSAIHAPLRYTTTQKCQALTGEIVAMPINIFSGVSYLGLWGVHFAECFSVSILVQDRFIILVWRGLNHNLLQSGPVQVLSLMCHANSLFIGVLTCMNAGSFGFIRDSR